IQVLAVGDALDLRHEIGPLPLRLQIAGPVLHVQPALFGDGELGGDLLVLGRLELFPAGEVFAAEEGGHVHGTQVDGSEVTSRLSRHGELDSHFVLQASLESGGKTAHRNGDVVTTRTVELSAELPFRPLLAVAADLVLAVEEPERNCRSQCRRLFASYHEHPVANFDVTILFPSESGASVE